MFGFLYSRGRGGRTGVDGRDDSTCNSTEWEEVVVSPLILSPFLPTVPHSSGLWKRNGRAPPPTLTLPSVYRRISQFMVKVLDVSSVRLEGGRASSSYRLRQFLAAASTQPHPSEPSVVRSTWYPPSTEIGNSTSLDVATGVGALGQLRMPVSVACAAAAAATGGQLPWRVVWGPSTFLCRVSSTVLSLTHCFDSSGRAT